MFLAQVGGNLPPARVPPPDTLPQQPPPVGTADNNGQPSLASRLFGGFFGGNSAPAPTQVAATDMGTKERGTDAAKPKPSHSGTTVASARPKASEKPAEKMAEPRPAEPAKAAPQETAAAKPKPAPQQQEANAAPPPTGGAVLKGGQPPVAAGSFDSRWSGLQ